MFELSELLAEVGGLVDCSQAAVAVDACTERFGEAALVDVDERRIDRYPLAHIVKIMLPTIAGSVVMNAAVSARSGIPARRLMRRTASTR